ncbi:MAG: hypothetical protein AAF805_13415 [Planctomycetota bacterium]
MRYRITDWFILSAILAAYGFAFAMTPIDYSLRPSLWIAAYPAGLCFVMAIARRRIGNTLVEWRPELWSWASPFVGLFIQSLIAFTVFNDEFGDVSIGVVLVGPLMHTYLWLASSVAVGRHGMFAGYRFINFGGPVVISWDDYRPTLEEGRYQAHLVCRWIHRFTEPRAVWETVDRRITVPAKHADGVRQAVTEIEANRAADD